MYYGPQPPSPPPHIKEYYGPQPPSPPPHIKEYYGPQPPSPPPHIKEYYGPQPPYPPPLIKEYYGPQPPSPPPHIKEYYGPQPPYPPPHIKEYYGPQPPSAPPHIKEYYGSQPPYPPPQIKEYYGSQPPSPPPHIKEYYGPQPPSPPPSNNGYYDLHICLLLQKDMVITVFDFHVLIAVTKGILFSNLQLHCALTKAIMIVSLYHSLAARINMNHILHFHLTKDLIALCLPFVAQAITNTTRLPTKNNPPSFEDNKSLQVSLQSSPVEVSVIPSLSFTLQAVTQVGRFT